MKVSPRKGRKFPRVPLTVKEAKRMFGEIDDVSKKGKMDSAAYILLWRCGLRNSEARAVRVCDIDFADDGTCVVNVMHGKGDKHRTVGLDERSATVIKDWLEVRNGLDTDPVLLLPKRDDNLAKNRWGKPLSEKYLSRLVKDLADRAGVKKEISAHTMRHTHAFELLDEGVDPMTIKEQLGQSSLAATMIYLNHLNPKKRHEQMKGRKW
jgi:integrase/recombinase XerD